MDLRLNRKGWHCHRRSRGIGEAIARTLAAEGMQLVLVARSGDQLAALAGDLPTACLVQAVDLRDPEAPATVIAATIARFGQLDLLVNNAGATKRGDFLDLPDSDWADGFALKLFGTMRCCRWPGRISRPAAAVLSISSASAGAPQAPSSRSAGR